MNIEQKLTPKYWVGHKIDSDDVFLVTANKDQRDACVAMLKLFGVDWVIDENLAVDLIELNLCLL